MPLASLHADSAQLDCNTLSERRDVALDAAALQVAVREFAPRTALAGRPPGQLPAVLKPHVEMDPL